VLLDIILVVLPCRISDWSFVDAILLAMLSSPALEEVVVLFLEVDRVSKSSDGEES
jgi:hypothetical protein